jgi:deoxyribonuclease V
MCTFGKKLSTPNQPRLRWPKNRIQALRLQQRLSKAIVLDTPLAEPQLIAGADISYCKSSDKLYAGVIVFSYPKLKIIERQYAIAEASFPYISGYLSFREGPALFKAISNLQHKPDLWVFDGQGIAHPRALGLASHLGVLLGKPSIGCAKSRLCGEYAPLSNQAGAYSKLIYKGQPIGAVLRTRTGVKPVFVSPGHLIGLEDCIKIIINCCRGYRLPEVTRLAHQYVNELRNELRSEHLSA